MAAGMSDHKEHSPSFGLHKFYVSSKIRVKKSSSSNKKITIFLRQLKNVLINSRLDDLSPILIGLVYIHAGPYITCVQDFE